MNKLTIISKNYGCQTIELDSYNPLFASTGSTLFKVIEHIFNDWYEKYTQPGAPLAKDRIGCYEGWGDDEPAVFTKKGAIRQGIEILIEEAKELGKNRITTQDILRMDIESAFEL